jgi:hypothetical protein
LLVNCATGWLLFWNVVPESGPTRFFPPTFRIWATPQQALANSGRGVLVLDKDQTVRFCILDIPCWDNLGGASLVVTNCRAEFNLDGVVNVTDFNIANGFLGTSGGWAKGDIDGDGTITSTDLDLILGVAVLCCEVDYNRDGFLNLDDLSDFITDFYTIPQIPGGLQVDAPTYADRAIGFGGSPCPNAGDAPLPYAVDAYRTSGFRTGYSSDGSLVCPESPEQNFPSLDNLSDYITAYYGPECRCFQ